MNYGNILRFNEPIIPNEYDGKVWVLIDGLGVVTKGDGNFKCRMLSIIVDFMILSAIYCFLFWVGRWYLLSTCVCTDPYLYVYFLVIVECSKRTVIFNSTANLSSLHYTRFQGELTLLAWTGSSSSCLDALKFRHGLAFYLF